MSRALGTLRGWLRPPRKLRVTFPGKWFLAITLGVGAAAINTGNNLLYLALSMNLGLIILSGILSEWSIRGVRVEVRPLAEAFAGRDSLLSLTCSAPGKRFPAMSIRVVPGLPAAGGDAFFPEIPGGGSATRVLRFLPSRRGPVPPFSCTVSTRFPFALFEKSLRVPVPALPLLVYPAPSPPGAPWGEEAGHPREGESVAPGSQGPFVRGVREHLPTDPFREIHWKASAKAGSWMVKEREAEADRAVDVRIPASCPEEPFERHLSEACGLVLRLEREGRPYRLLQGTRTVVGPAQGDRRRRALSFLALARPEPP